MIRGLRDRWDAELAELEKQLSAASSNPAREAVKIRIANLYREIDGAITEAGGRRSRVVALIERFKQLAADGNEGGPRPGDRPRTLHNDHLGASTFIEKGWSLIALGDHAGAEAALKRALELSPDSNEALALLGWAQMLDVRYDEALVTFSRVLAADPGHSLARVNVGFICLRKRIFGEAIEHLSGVIRLDNDRKAVLYAHFYLGLVYLEREMYRDAEAFFTKAVTLGPNLIEAYYELGRAQWFLGERDLAKATWKKGAHANRFAPWAERCREILETAEHGGTITASPSYSSSKDSW